MYVGPLCRTFRNTLGSVVGLMKPEGIVESPQRALEHSALAGSLHSVKVSCYNSTLSSFASLLVRSLCSYWEDIMRWDEMSSSIKWGLRCHGTLHPRTGVRIGWTDVGRMLEMLSGGRKQDGRFFVSRASKWYKGKERDEPEAQHSQVQEFKSWGDWGVEEFKGAGARESRVQRECGSNGKADSLWVPAYEPRAVKFSPWSDCTDSICSLFL